MVQVRAQLAALTATALFAAGSTGAIAPRPEARTGAPAGGGQVLATGAAVGWGGNFRGQVGDGTLVQRHVPTLVGTLTSGITRVDGGRHHSLALRADGRVLGWGSNDSGQLGDGTTVDRRGPVPVPGVSNVIQAAAGEIHSIVLRADGSVWTWGNNQFGQLGDGTTISRLTPAPVPSLTDVVQVVANGFHSMAVRSDGSVWAWGSNALGQLGDGTTIERRKPVRVPDLPFVTRLSAARFHTLALALNSQVFAWGDNLNGQLGDGTTIARRRPVPVDSLAAVSRVSAGLRHSVVLRTDGSVLTWGANDLGQLGDGSISSLLRLRPDRVPGLTGVADIAAGGYHTLALMTGGGVRVWGSNEFGQLGDGTSQNQPAPIPVPNLTAVTFLAAGDYQSLAVTGASPDFTLAVDPAVGTVSAGQSFTTLGSARVISGYARPVSLSVGSLPFGVTASVSPSTASPGYPATLTLTTQSTALNGGVTVTVAGTAGGVVRTVSFALSIVDGGDLGCTSGNHGDVPIPDNGPAVTSTIVVVGCDLARPPTVVSITVTIPHPRRGDLVVDLIGPDGTAYPVKGSDPTDTAPDMTGPFVVDLTGSSSVLAPVPPGANAWGLRARDVATGATGLIDSWTLAL